MSVAATLIYYFTERIEYDGKRTHPCRHLTRTARSRAGYVSGGRGGGYILGSACSVSPRVPPENLTVLVEAGKEFGPVA